MLSGHVRPPSLTDTPAAVIRDPLQLLENPTAAHVEAVNAIRPSVAA